MEKLTTETVIAAFYDRDGESKAGAMQLMDTDILLAAARGAVDLNLVAADMVASRGIGIDGNWVGFAEARRQMAMLIASQDVPAGR